MSVTTIISYDTATSFSFSSSEVAFTNSSAQLRDQFEKFQSEDFTSTTFGVGFTNNQNADISGGTNAGTLFASATVTSGELSLPAVQNSYCQWPATNNAPSGNQGTVEFDFTPTNSGSTSTSRNLFSLSDAEDSLNNAIRMIIASGTQLLRIDVYDSSGNSLFIKQTGNTFTMVGGTKKKVAFCYDSTNNEYRYFIDGTLIGGVNAGTAGSRGAPSGNIRVGRDYTSVNQAGAGGTIDNVILSDSVLYTANYSTTSGLPEHKYLSTGSVVLNTAIGASSLTSFAESSSLPSGTSVRYIVQHNSIDYWYDASDSAWETSNGTIAQANTVGAINTNANTFFSDNSLSGGDVRFKAFLVSPGTVTPALINNTVSYDFFVSTPAAPTECVVSGFMKDLIGEAITSATLGIEYSDKIISGNIIIPPTETTVQTDNDGRFVVSLVETETTSNSVTARFIFQYTQNNRPRQLHFSTVVIPNTSSASIQNLSGIS